MRGAHIAAMSSINVEDNNLEEQDEALVAARDAHIAAMSDFFDECAAAEDDYDLVSFLSISSYSSFLEYNNELLFFSYLAKLNYANELPDGWTAYYFPNSLGFGRLEEDAYSAAAREEQGDS